MTPSNDTPVFTSCAQWPDSVTCSADGSNVSRDKHGTYEQAAAVCTALEREGLGCEGKVFPIRTWVEQPDTPAAPVGSQEFRYFKDTLPDTAGSELMWRVCPDGRVQRKGVSYDWMHSDYTLLGLIHDSHAFECDAHGTPLAETTPNQEEIRSKLEDPETPAPAAGGGVHEDLDDLLSSVKEICNISCLTEDKPEGIILRTLVQVDKQAAELYHALVRLKRKYAERPVNVWSKCVELPRSLPSPPEGFEFLGMGPLRATNRTPNYDLAIYSPKDGAWLIRDVAGSTDSYFAARIGSEVWKRNCKPADQPPSEGAKTMKLTDLEPRWIQMGKDFGFHCLIGVSFLCPCCRRQRLAVMFTEHIDPENNAWRIPWQWPQGKTWSRQGLTFESLSLSPSIDASASGHWHGFITNGEIR